MRDLGKPSTKRSPAYRIVRPTATKPVAGQPLLDWPPVYRVHFYLGRTIPCLESDCPCTLAPMPTKERTIIPVATARGTTTVILDLPVSKWWDLREIGDRYGSLRRCRISAERTGPRNNSPIIIRHRSLVDADWYSDQILDPGPIFQEICVSSVEFIRSRLEAEKNGPSDLRLLNDRHVS